MAHLTVVDDLLAPEQWAQVHDALLMEPMRLAHSDRYHPIWRPQDGNPLVGEPIDDASPLSPVLQAVRALGDPCAEVVGAWERLSAKAFAYPQGTGLGVHTDDAVERLGAFTWYGHAEWARGWGGELIVYDTDGSGVGALVEPRPNRLVLVRAGTLHRVAPVEPEALGWVRRSVSGFFLL